MPSAEIIAIGTELLLGEIQDTNTRELAKYLKNAGIDLFRATLIGDNEERIANTVQDSLKRSDIVITTGGLGPTVDDPTREAVSHAMGVRNVFVPELWEQIKDRFQRYGRLPTENNRKQAYIPEGSLQIENTVGTAPAFIFEVEDKCIISLPGVPREMEHLMLIKILPFLKNKYKLHGIIKACVLHTAGVGESQVDEWVSEYEKLSNPSVGLLAHPGQTDVRITVKADSEEEADMLIKDMVSKIQPLLGDSLFGIDDVTIENVIKEKMEKRGWSIVVLENNLLGKLIERFEKNKIPLNTYFMLNSNFSLDDLQNEVLRIQTNIGGAIVLGASLIPKNDKTELLIVLSTPDGFTNLLRSWGGPPQTASLWAINSILDYLRRNI